MPNPAHHKHKHPDYLAKVLTITITIIQPHKPHKPHKTTSAYAITSLLAKTPLSLAPTPLTTCTSPTPSPPVPLYTPTSNLSSPPPVANSSITVSPQTMQSRISLAVVLMLAVITLAAVWTLTVCLLHWRGATTGYACKRACSPAAGAARRWVWLRRFNISRFKRVCETQYEALDCDGDGDVDADGARGVSSALELRAASPLNPYLVAPGREPCVAGGGGGGNTEEEWVLRHRAFFGVGEGEEDVVCLAEGCGAGAESEADTEAIVGEAREAQAREVLRACGVGTAAIDEGMRRCWVDVGLAAIDGAVDRFSARVVRWTDGGELVLPLAEGKKDNQRTSRGNVGQAMRVE